MSRTDNSKIENPKMLKKAEYFRLININWDHIFLE